MTTPVRTILDPLLVLMDAISADAVRTVLDLFPDAYRAGYTEALVQISGSLADDEKAGIAISGPRIMAALNGAIRLADAQPVPDVWAGR